MPLPNPPPAKYVLDSDHFTSITFSDGIAPFDALSHQAAVMGKNPYFYYPLNDPATGSWKYEIVTFRDAFHCVHALSTIHKEPLERLGLPNGENVNRCLAMTAEKPVIAFLDSSDCCFLTNLLFFNRLGFIVLILSPNNDPAASANLLSKIEITKLICGSRFMAAAKAIKQLKPDVDVEEFRKFTIEECLKITVCDSIQPVKAVHSAETRLLLGEQVPFIIHSSGSTNMPKPIILPNRYLFMSSGDYSKSDLLSWYVDYDFPNFAVLPMTHIFGLMCFIGRPLHTKQAVVLPTSFPPSSADILKTIELTKPCGVSLVPYFLTQLVKYIEANPAIAEESWALMRRVMTFFYGGASLPISAGNLFREKGVRVYSGWGTSEIGGCMGGGTLGKGLEYDAWEMNVYDGIHHQFEDVDGETDPNIKQLVILETCPTLALYVANRADGAFVTGDVFENRGPGKWYYRCRLDDQLVHVNGEKTNALAIELGLCEEKLILRAAAVGFGRPCCAALIQINAENRGTLTEEQVRAVVLEAMARVNASQPTHCRVPKELIYILQDGEVIPATPKGSIIRPKVDSVFAERINSMYASFLTGAPGKPVTTKSVRPAPPARRSQESYRVQLVSAVAEILGHDETVIASRTSASLFDIGLTSVQARQLHVSLQSEIGDLSPDVLYEYSSIDALSKFLESLGAKTTGVESSVDIKELTQKVKAILAKNEITAERPTESLFDVGLTSTIAISVRNDLQSEFHVELKQNFVFENSTLDTLVAGLAAIVAPAAEEFTSAAATADPYHIKDAEALTEKYVNLIKELSSFRPPDAMTEAVPKLNGHQVMVTGASGSLGNFIVKTLLGDEKVERIFALLRGDDATARMLSFWKSRKLNVEEFNNAVESKRLVCLSYNMKDPLLGQTAEKFDELQNHVSIVIHNSWKMDFNQKVTDFEGDCIRSVYNLAKFCGRPGFQKKRLVFVSSISSTAMYPEELIPPSVHNDARFAIPMGYGQSKWVSEHICKAAAEYLQIPTEIARFGQIGGDSENGCWNTKEMVPLVLVGGGGRLQSIPSGLGSGSLIPVDVGGRAVCEIALDGDWTSQCRVCHLVNPTHQSWTEFASSFKEAGLKFEFKSNAEFWDDLQKDSGNPARLLDAFLSSTLLASPESKKREARLSTVESRERLKSLRECEPMNAALAKKFLDHWREVGFLTA